MYRSSFRWTLTLLCCVYLTACNPVRMATNTMGLTEKGVEAGEKAPSQGTTGTSSQDS